MEFDALKVLMDYAEKVHDEAVMECYRKAKMGCRCGHCDPCEIAKMLLELRK